MLAEREPVRPAAKSAPEEMIIDLFAGGGGASEGIFMATGRHADVAVNHDPQAVALHAMNHPTTKHYCCDVHEVDPVEACSDDHGNLRPVALLWASPDCTHHSKARGGKPAEKKIRALAWVVVKWASKVRPRCIFLENVEEFQDWGPLNPDNRPDKERRGEIFQLWKSQLVALGYRVEHRERVAADDGTPTTRKRLALIARCDGLPIIWPEATHAPRSKLQNPGLFDKPMKPWKSAAEHIIDWSIPCPSIFGRKKPLAPKTHARIAKGIRRFVIESKQPFIVPVVNGTWNPDRSWPVDEPLRTVTESKGGDYALVSGAMVPRYGEAPGQEPRALDVGEPYPTVVPTGNGGDVAMAHLTKFRNGSHGADITDPMPTVTANSYVKRPGCGVPLGVVTAHLGRAFGKTSPGDVLDPMPTVVGKSKDELVAAHLGRQFGTAIGRDLNEPHPTVMSDGAGGKSYITTACLDAYYGMSLPESIDEPLRTITTKDRHGLIGATIDKYFGTGVAGDVTEPLDTATAKARFGLTSAFMEQANTGVVGHDAREPVSTLLAAGSHQRPVECEMEPVDGVPGSRRSKVVAFLREHFGEPTEDEVANPTGTLMARIRHGLVMIGKAVWQIADIGMRMLSPRELYNAQGFPRDYIIDRTANGPLTKTAQTRMAGNSVCPPWAAAIIAANDPLMLRSQSLAA